MSIICSGDGESDYDVNTILPTTPVQMKNGSTITPDLPVVGVTLDWFLGNFDCHLTNIGQHRLYVRWTIDRGTYFTPVDYERISNIFTVTDQAQLQKDLGLVQEPQPLAVPKEFITNDQNN